MSTTVSSASAVMLLPKNRGLAAQTERALAAMPGTAPDNRYALRGEDIPYLSSQFACEGRDVVAFTGEDLLENWLAAGNVLDPRLSRRSVPWFDRQAIYAKPALCLIGPPDADLRGKRVRIAVCARYQNLAARYLDRLQSDGDSIEISLIHGALESIAIEGLADFIVDIVVTGKTIRDAGLSVHKILFQSDLAVLETR